MKNLLSKKSALTGTALMLTIFTVTVITSCKKSNLVSEPGYKIPGFTALPSSILPNTISNGLIAYWSCANTAYDLSGNGNNGTLSNITSTSDRFGHAVGAYSFNGTSSYISIPDVASLRLSSGDFTVNAWVKLNSYNTSYGSVIVGKRTSGSNNGWSWGITGSAATTTGVVNFNPGTTPFGTGSTVVGLSAWHMVTSVYTASSGELDVYVDGTLDNSTTGVSQPSALATASLYIGQDDPSIGGYHLDGALSDIRIYNRTITTTEITALYNATTAPTDGLLAFWPLTNTANDLSGNSHNGTANSVSTATDRLGNSIGAYAFNGTSSNISVPDDASLRLSDTAFTMNAWVKLNSYNTSASIIMGKRVVGVGNSGWSWGLTSGGVVNYSPGTTPNGTGTSAVGTSAWHMVTVTYRYNYSQTISIYIDGTLDHTITGVSEANASTTASLYIGSDNPNSIDNGYFLNGSLNDLRIYSRAITTTEIGQLYNALD